MWCGWGKHLALQGMGHTKFMIESQKWRIEVSARVSRANCSCFLYMKYLAGGGMSTQQDEVDYVQQLESYIIRGGGGCSALGNVSANWVQHSRCRSWWHSIHGWGITIIKGEH